LNIGISKPQRGHPDDHPGWSVPSRPGLSTIRAAVLPALDSNCSFIERFNIVIDFLRHRGARRNAISNARRGRQMPHQVTFVAPVMFRGLSAL
jgi:hypothetical protein